ncbi:amino acid ABC transporter permease [Brenneria tiliae]|uniref:Amino acid ABC transporter permease n=1 Tax=Brenneria tiliae TaxID=2914984 RepID=A0ABT0MX47_9GAMM|nr:amino acid ABC transporter permease [Brenneria tiliae]MCL2894167.1 amino acid ABC transporter permease [Brenneria tiliae]MCL2898846.1 amino acid ABC transporter permease [Brenneria tiliae]MCL2903217.1 amino acid ABC transporter permease [Brenneria tiliae]
MMLDFAFILHAVVEVLPAVPTTLFITLTSVAFGFVGALGIVYINYFNVPVLTQISKFYVSFFRGTPMVLHIFLFFYGFPHFFDALAHYFSWPVRANSIPLSALVIGGLSMSTAAFFSEILRSGISAISMGELDASVALGMTRFQMMRRLLLPQAVLYTIKNLSSRSINVLHASSIAYWISVVEITGKTNLVASTTYQFVEAFIAAAIIYWCITLSIEVLSSILDRKLHARLSRGL